MEDHPQPPVDQALANLDAALTLLEACITAGVQQWVLCPGSRSGPLAVAIGLLERRHGVVLTTGMDERSAAFFALGHGRWTGVPAAVITTSGSAVANLLPALVEADFGAIPLLLITADRPLRLKNCGANQTVNQDVFLRDSVRRLILADPAGLHRMGVKALRRMACQAVSACQGQGRQPPGGVHLNLPIEEPLHADPGLLSWSTGPAEAEDACLRSSNCAEAPAARSVDPRGAEPLDPDRPGLIVAGPWRGRPQHWAGFARALRELQHRTGWPLLADALSGLRGEPHLDLIAAYDLLLARERPDLQTDQVLRLGPVPASRRLQDFLVRCGGRQLVISETEPRSLDPLGTASHQEDCGLQAWWQHWQEIWPATRSTETCRALSAAWLEADRQLQNWLDQELGGDAAGAASVAAAPFSEPSLVRQLAASLPARLPVVLANSSPVRDWESFMPPDGPQRPVLSFRGGSGIDGTLSLACGVAQASGAAALVSGDLALQHDSNGWLWRQQLKGRLTVLLIDNDGGGIFEQLPIRQPSEELLDFERLFAMPQSVDPLALAAAHGVPGREPRDPDALERDLRWALAQPIALLRLRCNRRADAARRRQLRTMGAALTHQP